MDGATNTLKWSFLALAVLLALPLQVDARKKKDGTCPVPDGVTCMGLDEVYRRTESSATVQPLQAPEPARNPAPAPATQPQTILVSAPTPRGPVAYRPVKHADAVAQGDTLAVVSPVAHVVQRPASAGTTIQQYRPPSPDPVRAPAKVMRILVSAWEDDGGSLHMPGTIFTEIEPRRWNVGAQAVTPSEGFHLLEGLGEKAAKESQASAPSASAVANRPGS